MSVNLHPVSSLDWWFQHQPASEEARMNLLRNYN